MILGLIEHDRGKPHKASWEMLTLARKLAGELDTPLEAVIVGESGRSLAQEAAAYGVARVHLVQHERLDDYAPEAWAQSLIQLIGLEKPQAVLAAGTDRGNEVLAHLAAKSDLPLAANCTEVQPGENYRVTRVRWGGSLLEEARLHGQPKLLTVAPHVIPAEGVPGAGEVALNPVTPALSDKDFRVRVVSRVESARDKVSLTDARVVVSGGRGVGSTEGFESLEELAALLNGAVGCSRAVTNEGWRPHADQVGQTGSRVAPEVYFACGISGAIQHYVGCKGSKNIIAINNDPEAPIIAKAHYAVIGDLHQVVPAISEAIRKARSG
ncbi:MAG: electron transfer flavoprotein subunit alpha/FixB family protein [Anaerolineales bacterium]|nr:electron transfer flavoprotein subunit alpha/FixB family protein [Anaerolineales bacterium]